MNVLASEIEMRVDEVTLEGTLSIPEVSTGMVICVYGSGSSRNSPRNQFVVKTLNEGGLATFLFDLLTSDEERVDSVTRHLRFKIGLLARRTTGAVDWLSGRPEAAGMSFGFLGSNTGAAAAMITAVERPELTGAIVSGGGRPDLADLILPQVEAPVLLLVGERDKVMIELNQEAFQKLPSDTEKRLEIIPRATHLFEEPGALEQVAARARDWFIAHLNSNLPGNSEPA